MRNEDLTMIHTTLFVKRFLLTLRGWRKLKFNKEKPVEFDNDFMGVTRVKSSPKQSSQFEVLTWPSLSLMDCSAQYVKLRCEKEIVCRAAAVLVTNLDLALRGCAA